jgi:hypothetical protein
MLKLCYKYQFKRLTQMYIEFHFLQGVAAHRLRTAAWALGSQLRLSSTSGNFVSLIVTVFQESSDVFNYGGVGGGAKISRRLLRLGSRLHRRCSSP